MTKYEKISVLARETAKRISANREEWIRYLDVASRLYKYPFEDQILIYAQRPDATACASLEMWNEKMFCWVNRGAKGIALLDGESERPRLRYVFDVTDVHKARRIGRDPFIWHLREEHKEAVLAGLEHIYGSTNDSLSFESRIYEIAAGIAEDFYEEAVDEVIDAAANSFLEDLDGDVVSVRFREMLVQSVSYIVLKRCGCDMTEFADDLTFDYIHEFNTLRTLSVLGSSTSELCEPMLVQIGRTIARYNRETARKQIPSREPLPTNNQKERQVPEHESDIRKEWGLSYSQPDTGRGERNADEIRSAAKELSENKTMLADIREKAELAMPIVAECGGFMYLHQTMEDTEHHVYEMAGVVPGDCFYTGKLVRFGYIELTEKESNFLPENGSIKGHEFHYFDSTANGDDCVALKPVSGKKYDCVFDKNSCFVGFPHLYYPSAPQFAENFVKKAKNYADRSEVNS